MNSRQHPPVRRRLHVTSAIAALCVLLLLAVSHLAAQGTGGYTRVERALVVLQNDVSKPLAYTAGYSTPPSKQFDQALRVYKRRRSARLHAEHKRHSAGARSDHPWRDHQCASLLQHDAIRQRQLRLDRCRSLRACPHERDGNADATSCDGDPAVA
jgi:hypothetical protein